MFAVFLYLFLTFGASLITTRPSFNSIHSSATNNIKYTDSTTGFPLHSNVFQQTIDINNTYVQRERRSIFNKLHKMKLKSDAKLHPTACIALNAILALESVQCQFNISQQLILTFNSVSNASRIYRKWLLSNAKFISGGIEWGCLNETTQEPLVIIQRIESFELKKQQIIIKTIKDTNISPLVCFTNITMSLTAEYGNSKMTTKSRAKRATTAAVESKLSTDSWSFIPLEPYGNEIVYPGQKITIRWSYLNIDSTNDLQIVLNRQQFGLDAELNRLSTSVNAQQISFTIPLSLEISSYDQYYFEFSFRRKLGWYQKTSAIFYIPTRLSIIPRSPPAINDIYYPGDFIPIKWESANFNATSKVTVRFYRTRVSIITDVELDTFSVIATANIYNYTISSSLNTADSDTYYYFEFDCKLYLNYRTEDLFFFYY